MRHPFALVLIIGCLCAQTASALDLANLRVSNGPLGTKRQDNKFLPGDVIFVTFDILDITLTADGGAKYQTTMEIFDENDKSQGDKQVNPPQGIVLLGGKQIRSNAFAVVGTAQVMGKYKIKITVDDLEGKKKKTLTYDFEVLPLKFGFVQPDTPALALAGTDFRVGFSLVGMQFDAKDKLPDVELTLRVFDQNGKEVTFKPWKLNVLKFHNPPAVDLTKKEVIPAYFLLFLNRPGQYTIQADAEDVLGKEKCQMKFPVKVLDPAELIGN